MTDTISDMFNRIKSAQAVSKETVMVPFSNLKYEIAKILQKEGFIEKVEKKGRSSKKIMDIVLKYNDKKPVISGIKRISKSGQRVYIRSKKIRKVKEGYGVAIVSTPKGLMTDKEAKKARFGGEIICEIW
ncbi:MAG: 30S ribosomal protein S8, small subunit ribosomal protein S8 [Parcubacteria group bacterium GW2011_GWC1_38_6]|nr:MAG: 30S ribosomal protein S8 [Parcubacteria group bacterium GW2011_GWA1_36_12]KKQ77317.1 MAG: 30S ribosomal protein S8, small subunit ribosomal protein S8 [Parcubacteria group bacterium GW2011_GWC1_38_6]